MIGGAITAVVLFIYFTWWELRSDSPMLDLRMFRNRVLSIGSSARLFAFLGSSATFLLMPIYLIGIRGFEAAFAGGILFLSPVGVAIAAQLSGRLGDKYGTKPFLIAGYTATAIAAAAFAFATTDTPIWTVMIILFMSGAGMGTWNVTSNSVIMGAAPSAAMGVVGALTNLIRNIGTVVGQAVMTTVIVGVMISRDVDIPLSEVSESPDATLAYMAGWRIAFGAAVVFNLIALALSMNIRLRRDVDADESSPAAVPSK
jgi:MFS family permease